MVQRLLTELRVEEWNVQVGVARGWCEIDFNEVEFYVVRVLLWNGKISRIQTIMG